MVISLAKGVCGNCTLRGENARCSITGDKKESTELACFVIGKNFKDNGYEYPSFSEPIAQDLDFEAVKKEAEDFLKLLDKFEKKRKSV